MKSDMMEIRVRAHRDEKLVTVVWSVTASANGKNLPPTLGFFSGSTTTRILQDGRSGLTSTYHRAGKSKQKSRLSSSEEMQAPADAEQELYFKRPPLAEFLGVSSDA